MGCYMNASVIYLWKSLPPDLMTRFMGTGLSDFSGVAVGLDVGFLGHPVSGLGMIWNPSTMMVRLVLPLWTLYMMKRARPVSPMAPFSPARPLQPRSQRDEVGQLLVAGKLDEIRLVGSFRPPSVLLKSTTDSGRSP